MPENCYLTPEKKVKKKMVKISQVEYLKFFFFLIQMLLILPEKQETSDSTFSWIS